MIKNSDNSYMNFEQICDHFFKQIDTQSKEILARIKKEDLIQFHHSTGQFIRNNYGLWAEDNPHVDNTDPSSPIMADQFSYRVMEYCWEKEND